MLSLLASEEKTEWRQRSTEPNRNLGQVKWAFTASAKPQTPLEHNIFPQAAFWSPLLVSLPLPLPVGTHLYFLSLEAPRGLHKGTFAPVVPPCPSVPTHTLDTLPEPTASAFCPQCSLVQLRVSEETSPCLDIQRSFCSM